MKVKYFSVFSSSLLIFVGIFYATFAGADELIVGHPDSHEYKTLDLAKGETGDITVYLQTAGAELDGFRVVLVKDGELSILKSEISKNDGIIKFPMINAGKYDVILRKEGEKVMDVYVSIGDIMLARTPVPKEEKKKNSKEKIVSGKDEKEPGNIDKKSLSEEQTVEYEDEKDSERPGGKEHKAVVKRKIKQLNIQLGEGEKK